MAVQVVPGFSLTNRWLLYTSYFLAPAQFVSGLNSNCPSDIGFLAYNWYTQIQWYKLMSGKDEIHAISLLLPHFNLLYCHATYGLAARYVDRAYHIAKPSRVGDRYDSCMALCCPGGDNVDA
ncbi:hypothetical protein MYCTH_2301215 [Thermothelomyces thermophilus ATCC 42464]|uniref:Uncharacterized protein n=1 Tax=Thermothelomyces thermophilus (strain ATCC 42464 / BCRC 31852 / DSM 1799) TaxID=573729 RepID=G2Q9B6_THET4|nr:uncharacterized protein MYCTH_2301215 [Thermothelomyces thermophilus ATCC 42464]AEO56375.1 hypothetical protein MYCTH_2301215 [Thermothelomyces thermophilus ATCC 42464]